MDAIMRGNLTPEMVRSDEIAQKALAKGHLDNKFMRSLRGLPFYMSYTAPTEESSAIAFERHFNPQLKHDSEYFKQLNEVLSCVERNVAKNLTPEEESAACKQEFKKMRLTAFNNELLYHNVNKRFYMDLIQYKRHEAPF